jgi:4'-phosphopantetheinyl transferase
MTDVVHVWWAEPTLADQRDGWLDPRDGWLDRTERRRLGRMGRADDRARFVTSRALLKGLLGAVADVPARAVGFDYECATCGEPHGKPSVARPSGAIGWQVSLAHAGSRVVVGASTAGSVGVDVERVDGLRFAEFPDVAVSEDQAAAVADLAAGDRDRAAATAWVRKEALLKATGEGLAVDPRTVDLAALGGEVTLVDVSVGDGYAAAVAVLASGQPRVEVVQVVEMDQMVEVVEVTEIRRGASAAPPRAASSAAAR